MKRTILLTLTLLLFSGCIKQEPYDYSAFSQHPPRSILVIPPLNNSVEVTAPYAYLSTITRPLAECGYYVFPVAVIDALLKDNGLPTPGEMNQVPLDKIREVIGADAVLYITIDDWGQKYQVFSSVTVVNVQARLVDVDSGIVLWEGSVAMQQGNNNGNNDSLLGMAVGAMVDQVAGSLSDRAHELSATANHIMIFDTNKGLPFGPYNPNAATDPRR